MANHTKPIPDPNRKPEAPPVRWLTLVRAAEGDYRVLALTTKGVPAEARRGDQSTVLDEAEERFKLAAADLFDSLSSIEGELYLPPAQVEQTCMRCGVTWLTSKPIGCPRCEAWDKAITACQEKLKTTSLFQDLKVQR